MSTRRRFLRSACRAFLAITASCCAASLAVSADKSSASSKSILYAAVGPELSWYEINFEDATLNRQGSVTLPASVQEAWPHPSRHYLYVGWSDGGASFVSAGAGAGPAGTRHGLTAFRIDPSGALQPHGSSAVLRARPIYLTTDVPGTHVLVAYNNPSGLSVHGLRPDGTIAEEIKQSATLDTGIYGHQIRVEPSNRTVILVTRGNAPTDTRAEDPGALKIFDYRDGVLTNRASIAPNGGFGFQSRHLDFHPTQPWFYLTLERQNKLQMYAFTKDAVKPDALFTKETLAQPTNVRQGQTTSAIHVHPNGKFVYLGNRAGATQEVDGKQVLVGGENTIAAYAIDQHSGEPRLLQTIDTQGIFPRTFTIDPSGKILIVANQVSATKRTGDALTAIPASLAVFRIRSDGTLEFARKYDIDLPAGSSLFWTGIVRTAS